MIMNIRRFLKNRKGATAIEYGLIAAGIAVAVIAIFGVLEDDLTTAFGDIGASLTTKTGEAATAAGVTE